MYYGGDYEIIKYRNIISSFPLNFNVDSDFVQQEVSLGFWLT